MATDPIENVNPAGELRSDFATDPDMREILEIFVREMPTRVGELLGSWERQELEKVGRLAHQLKGAGGGYGFGVISDAAAALERSVATLRAAPTGTMIEEAKAQVDRLADLCKRVTAR
jgi:HPt (histidine-containing phosphotransfer) domain-containing protein